MAITKRRSSTRSGLFLTELIIAILFFSLASAICTQLFVKAYTISNNSRDLSVAINQIQSAAESFKASDGSYEDVLKIVEGRNALATDDNWNEICLLFDSDWNEVKSEPQFELRIKLDGQNPVTATIAVSKLSTEKPKETIYEIQAKKYITEKP